MNLENTQIIPQTGTNMHLCWQKELSQVITDPKKLLELVGINPDDYIQHFGARKLFPVRVPRPFINRMEKNNINDPLLKQVMPLADEFITSPDYSTDPLAEHDTVAEGLLHKYQHRVLMIVKAGCAVNCRYCFRRHFPYADNSPNKQRWREALTYIDQHPEINEVIFSGGDPLMASDDHLHWLINAIENISHVKRLRIHTRLPVMIPQRITPELVALLTTTRLKTTMVLHINHANEIDSTLVAALMPLKQANIPLFNQSVLLKSINDSSEALAQLCEKLFDHGIQPYYLHLFDAVQAAAHFDVDEQKAKKLYQQLLATLPGYMVPKLVREIPGETNKTPITLT